MAFEDPHWARFVELFRGLERAHGTYELDTKRNAAKKGKIEGRAFTVRSPVTDALWSAHLHGKQGLGIVPINDEGFCWFGAIDVDLYDIDIKDVDKKVRTVIPGGLPLLPTRTKSGGVHLYCFGKEPLPAPLLRARLEEWSVVLGFGGCEIFPKQNALLNASDVGNWINMPYFGAAVGATERYGIWEGEALSFEDYGDLASRMRISVARLEAIEVTLPEDFVEGPPCLQSMAARGFPEGNRNNALFSVGVYLKKRFPEEWESYLYIYNRKFCKPPMSDAELKNSVVKSLSRGKDYGYKCNDAPCKNFCNKNICRTREFGIGKGKGELNIAIDNEVQYYDTYPPSYILIVNGMPVQFLAEQLLSQAQFKLEVFKRLNYVCSSVAQDKWIDTINKAMESAKPIPMPANVTPLGELRELLEDFVHSHTLAETREEMLTGKPFIEDKIAYFRMSHLQRHLKQQQFKEFDTTTKLGTALRRLGVLPITLRIGEVTRQVWSFTITENGALSVPPKDIDKGAM